MLRLIRWYIRTEVERKNYYDAARKSLISTKRWNIVFWLLVICTLGAAMGKDQAIGQKAILVITFIFLARFAWVMKREWKAMHDWLCYQADNNPEAMESFDKGQQDYKEKEISSMQATLQATYQSVGYYEERGDFERAAEAKGRAKRLESELRQRGA